MHTPTTHCQHLDRQPYLQISRRLQEPSEVAANAGLDWPYAPQLAAYSGPGSYDTIKMLHCEPSCLTRLSWPPRAGSAV